MTSTDSPGPTAAHPDDVLAARASEELDELPPEVAAAQVSGHCKDGPHLRLIAVHGTGHGSSDQTFRELLNMVCPNTHPPANPWGAVIDPQGKQEGMHFLPGGVLYLANWFPTAVDEARALGADGCVGLQHTDTKVLTTWRLFVPDTAAALGASAKALSAKHGYTG